MKAEWLGEYKELVGSIICFANGYSQIYNKEFMGTDIMYSFSQIQVIEHLINYEDLNQKMAEVAHNLGLTTSSFTKLVNKLVKKGLLKKYHASDNKKDVIVRVTEDGRRIYQQYSKQIAQGLFSEMFQIGDQVPREYISLFTQMMHSLSKSTDLKGEEAVILVPVEENRTI